MARVLVTGFCAVPGPQRCGVQVRHVIRALTADHNVDVLVPRDADQAYVERQGSVRVLRVPRAEGDFPTQIAAFQRAIRRQLEGDEYNIIHCLDPWTAQVVLEARDRHEIAVVYDAVRSPPAVLDYSDLVQQCAQRADLVIVEHRDAWPTVPPLKLAISALGVDVDRFDWDVAPPATDAARLVFVGSDAHGVEVAIEALSKMTTLPAPHLVIAGELLPLQLEQLAKQVQNYGVVDRVQCLGALDHEQVPILLATASLALVLRPPTANAPSKLLEYWACKRAVLCADDGTATYVNDGVDVATFSHGDAGGLAAVADSLLASLERQNALADAGYARVRSHATASSTRRSIRAAYAMLGSRFTGQAVNEPRKFAGNNEDSVRISSSIDDDFDVTVFEQAPAAPSSSEEVRPAEAANQRRSPMIVAGTIDEPARLAHGARGASIDVGALPIEVSTEELSEQDFIPIVTAAPLRFRSSATTESDADVEPDTGDLRR
jgi:glycosyltransferase involved in cell wall biosynthesis